MKLMLRACGVAAAALACLAVAASADPLIAANGDAAPMTSSIDGHALAVIADDMAGLADAAVPKPRTLNELVGAHTGPVVRNAEHECLANAVYFEARGEPLEGQLAVADVVMNRVASPRYPDTICDVVLQPWQFSFVRNGRMPAANRASDAWRKAVAVADLAMADAARELGRDILWYHADYVAPGWGKRLSRQRKIGLHIFYS